MPEFQRKQSGFTHKGIQWNYAADKVPDGQILYGRNIRVPQEGVITQRPGSTSFSNLGGTYTHSISRLNNSNTTLVNFDFTFVIGQDNSLFVGKTNTILTNGSLNPVKLPPSGSTNTLSGNPLTLVDMDPVASPVGWKYVGDSTQNLKVGYYPGDNPASNMARAITMGMTPPVDTAIPAAGGGGNLSGNYQWIFAFRNKFTGERSNPSAATRVTLASPALSLSSQAATFTLPTTPIDPQTGSADANVIVDVYRFGGTINDWRYVGTDTSGASFTDNLPDSAILTAPTPPEITDPITGATRFNSFRPFVTQDAPRYSSSNNGTATQAGGTNIWTLTAGGGDTFNLQWLPGSTISINNQIFTIYQVRSTTVIEIAEDATGVLTSGVTTYPWATQGALTAGQPLPHLWGPYGTGISGAYIFGCGDIFAEGTLYWTNGNDPDSTDLANSLVVTSPSEPLVTGCVYDGTPYVWSTERLFRIYPNLTVAGQFYVQEVPGGKGVLAEWSLTVQSNGISDQSVTWVGKDGIYDFSTGGGVVSLTDRDLYPFFPHDNQAGIGLTTLFPFITENASRPVNAPDYSSSNIKYHRLCWRQGELYYDHVCVRSGPTNVYNTLVYDSKQVKGWVSLDQYQGTSGAISARPVMRGIEIAANNMKIGIGPEVLDCTGTEDAGNGIAARVTTRQDDFGDPRGQKLYGDFLFDAAAADSGGISVIPLIAIGTSSLPTQSFTSTGRSQSIFSTSTSGLGILSNTFGLDITWVAGTGQVELYQWILDWVPKPEIVLGRALDKTDDGWNGQKYLRGFVIETNTFNSPRKVNVLVDGTSVASVLTINANGQIELPFSFTPAVGTEFQLAIDASDTSTAGWEVFQVRWVWEKWPELTAVFSAWMAPLSSSKPKYIRGFTMPVDTNGSGVVFKVAYDSVVGLATLPSVNTTANRKTGTPFVFSTPIIAHEIQLQPQAACRYWPEEIIWDAEEWPEITTEVSAWMNFGSAKPRYVRGFTIPVDTGGSAVDFVITYDGTNTSTTASVTTTANEKSPAFFALTSPIVGHQFQIAPSAAVRPWWNEIVWDAEEWPELLQEVSPWLNLGTEKPRYVRGFTIPVDTGGGAVSFTLQYDGASTVTTVSATTAANQKSPAFFGLSAPVLLHNVQLQPSGAVRAWWNEIVWDAEEWPELLAEFYPFQNLGTSQTKYLRSFEVPVETNNSSARLKITSDLGASVTFSGVTSTALVKSVFPFVPTSPLIAHEFQLSSLDPARVWFGETKWDFEVWPEIDTMPSPWLDAGTPGAKFMRGLVMPIDTGGSPVTFDITYDGGTVTLGPYTTTANQKTSITFPFVVPIIFHEFQIRPRTNCRMWYNEIKWDFDPWPEFEAESSSWVNAGDPGAKFMQGFVIPLDTGGLPVSFTITYDGGTVTVGPVTTPTNHKTPVPFSFNTPFIAHEFIITPSANCRTWYDEVKWIWEPTPELTYTWDTQETDHDLPGFHYMGPQSFIAYVGGSDSPTFTVTTEYGSVVYTLPPSNGVYQRYQIPMQPQKAKWRKYAIFSSGGIRLFLRDTAVMVAPWGNTSAFRSYQPFGEISRAVGARI